VKRTVEDATNAITKTIASVLSSKFNVPA